MWPTIDFDADALPWSRPPVHWDWGCWGGGRDDSGEAEQKNLQHYTLPRADYNRLQLQLHKSGGVVWGNPTPLWQTQGGGDGNHGGG